MTPIRSMLVLAMLLPASAWAQATPGLKINEFLPNPSGTDGTKEWVELHNSSGSAIDISGYKLQSRSTQVGSVTTILTIPASTSIAAGAYLVIAGDATGVPGSGILYKGSALSIPNAGTTSADVLRVVTGADVIVDLVVYGGQNTVDLLQDESGSVATSLAPYPAEGLVLARSPNGTDTNLSGDDFIATGTATMAAANPNPPTCDLAAGLVVNELLPNPTGTGSTAEYVEIYNGASGRTVKLEGWKLEWGTSSFGDSHIFANTVEIAAGEYLVLGGSAVAGRDVEVAGWTSGSAGMGDASSNSDAVRLVDCAGTVLDTVVYGTPNTSAFIDDTGVAAASLAPKGSEGDAIARRENGVDTNASAADFHATTSQTPGAANPVPPAPGVCEPDTDTIVINEFLPNPSGSDLGHEWVEIYNRGTAPRRVDGWTIRAATTTATFSLRATLPTALEIPAGGRILVGEASVAGATATVAKLDLGSGSDGDAVRLVDCAGNVVDTVAYSPGGNADAVPDDSGVAATSLATAPSEGRSLARKRDGVDTDQSGEDFAVTANPTPGAANPELICVQNTGNVKLNEILPDPDGSDSEAAAEFIELYNAGSEAVDLDGWQLILSGAGDDRTVDLVLPPVTRITATSWFVIGNANVAEADLEVDFSLGNGTGGDAVYLLDCTGAMVDSVAYGPDNTDLVTDESNGVATVAGNPGESRTLARTDDGVDSNAASDWFVDATPTPGATNFQEGVSVPPDDETGGCKREGPPDDGAPEGGCSTVPVSMGGMALLPLLLAIRRRRG